MPTYTYVFRALFTASKIGVAPASAPTVDVCDSAGTLVVTNGAATALSGVVGLYGYSYTSATPGEYVALFKTSTSTVDLQHIPSWTPTVIYTNLDTNVGSRNAIAPPTVEAIADQVWDELSENHVTSGTTGKKLYDTNVATSRIGDGLVTVVSPVSTNGYIELRRGDDYLTIDNRAFVVTGPTWLDLTDATITLHVRVNPVVSVVATMLTSNTCSVEFTSTDIEGMGVGYFDYDIEAVYTIIEPASVRTITFHDGKIGVINDIR